jgi:hypothetical protein
MEVSYAETLEYGDLYDSYLHCCHCH